MTERPPLPPYPLGIDHEHDVAIAARRFERATDMQRLREAWFRCDYHTSRDPRVIEAKDAAKTRLAATRQAAQ